VTFDVEVHLVHKESGHVMKIRIGHIEGPTPPAIIDNLRVSLGHFVNDPGHHFEGVEHASRYVPSSVLSD
jgi:hypothetical protein